MLDWAVPRWRRIAHENLSMALPELSARERNHLIDGVFASIGRVLATFAQFPKIHRNNVGHWIRCEGMDRVDAALARGRGVIFATGHLGNWELSAFAFALLERPIHVVVRPLDNPWIDALVERYRELSGNQLIGKSDYIRRILEALRRNEMVGILADQHTQDGVVTDFFGRPASASAGIARIAAGTGAAVIPGFALWSAEEKKYVLRFFEEVSMSGDVRADTQQVQTAMEAVVRQYPDQWLWIHRRWKMP
jgi:KDO2-lipid IV(A) lauroyltransferase